MIRTVSNLVRGIDRRCARLNPGLVAVAIVLGAIVLAKAITRVEENLPAAVAAAGNEGYGLPGWSD